MAALAEEPDHVQDTRNCYTVKFSGDLTYAVSLWGKVLDQKLMLGPYNDHEHHCFLIVNEVVWRKARLVFVDRREKQVFVVEMTQTDEVDRILEFIESESRITWSNLLGSAPVLCALPRKFQLKKQKNDDTDAFTSQLRPMDIISRRIKHSSSWHFGVYIGDGRIVDYGSSSSSHKGLSPKAGLIVSERSLEEFLKGANTLRVEYFLYNTASHLENAIQKFHGSLYSITTNNCEHFARFVVTGKETR
jgi:hypothetical protein